METVVASRGYELSRVPGAIIINVREQRGVWPTICGFAMVVGALLSWFCLTVTGSRGVGIAVAVVFVLPPAAWWLIVAMRRRSLTVAMTADALIVGKRRYLRSEIRSVGVRAPGAAAFVATGPLGAMEAVSQARVASIALSQRYALAIQYGHEDIDLSNRLTEVVTQDLANEISGWLAASAIDLPTLTDADVTRLLSTSGDRGKVGLKLMVIATVGWIGSMLAYAPHDLAEGLLGLLLWPLLGPLMLMGAHRDMHGVTFPPDAIYHVAGAVLWLGIALSARRAWRSRGRKRAATA